MEPSTQPESRASHLSRRGFLLAGGAGALSWWLAGCGSNNNTGSSGAKPNSNNSSGTTGSNSPATASAGPTTTTGGSSPGTNALGLKLPDGAAPAGDQYYVQPFDSTGASYKALDFYETVYSRAPLADEFTIPLVRLDNNYNIVPGAATHWEQSADKLSWTFHIRPGIMWSDGNELTANDYVQTLRYSADPKHAWDFTWFWSGVIKNYTQAVAGKMPTSAIGVKQGKDKYTLVFETEGPIAFMDSACLYTTPLSAAGLAKYGSGSYNINPKTCISCGPYILTTFEPTSTVVLGPNKKYTGPFKPPIDGLIAKIYAGGDMLPRFSTGEIDTINVTALDLKVAKKTPKVQDLKLYTNPNDFEIWYTFFNTKTAPFDNMKVRQAFAHAVDRNAIINSLLAPLAIPAYGYLMPGYPFAVTKPLEPLTNYDPAKAKQLMSEAGFPGGKGFPEVTFNWWANAPSNTELVVQALTQGWNKTLGINIKLAEMDKTTFYSKMEHLPTQLQMGFVSYGMDYFDASNMLSVYKAGGRHNWDNAEYDKLLAQGAAESDTAKRQEIYTKAQILLTEQAPAVFIFHLLYGYLYWPYIEGPALAMNKDHYDGIQWPGFYATSTSLTEMYVGNNVTKYPRQSQNIQL
ncbi:MAG TPA: peptide ABC transporter substrate-binding protein [Acidimicrobiales bacterium]|nr:peptide ABC transporter substrate-binding protein [Acidimicrobiales bacterium]